MTNPAPYVDVNATANEAALGVVRTRRLHYAALHQQNLSFVGARPAGHYPDALVEGVEGVVGDRLTGGPMALGARTSTVLRFPLVEDGTPRVFWLSLRVPVDAAPGDHVVSARVVAPNGCVATAEASFRVPHFTLPPHRSQLTAAQFSPREANGSSFSNATTLAFFESLAAQGINAFAWFELDTLPWSPTYTFDANLTAVTIDGAAHREWWPRVLTLPGVSGAPWRLPFSSRLPKAWGSLPHLLPDNCSWGFMRTSADGSVREEILVPMFNATAPRSTDGATALNPEFVRLFLLLFRAVTRYVRQSAATWPGGAEAGMWVQIADEPTWTDEPTARNMLAIMQLYREADPDIRIYQTRFPQGPGPAEPRRNLSAPMQAIIDHVDWWCCHVCQAVDPLTYPWLRALRRERGAMSPPRVFRATVYDNGVPVIEAPWERVRSQALDVFNANGTVDGTLSWYSVNSYGAPMHDPWRDPYPTRTPTPANPLAIKDPAGWGYLLWPAPPSPAPATADWRPVESVRWLMVGLGVGDAEHAAALQSAALRAARAGAPSAAAQALLARTRAFASRWPAAWNPECALAASGAPRLRFGVANFSDDGYFVDTATEVDGSSAINEWRLAAAAEIDRLDILYH